MYRFANCTLSSNTDVLNLIKFNWNSSSRLAAWVIINICRWFHAVCYSTLTPFLSQWRKRANAKFREANKLLCRLDGQKGQWHLYPESSVLILQLRQNRFLCKYVSIDRCFFLSLIEGNRENHICIDRDNHYRTIHFNITAEEMICSIQLLNNL